MLNVYITNSKNLNLCNNSNNKLKLIENLAGYRENSKPQNPPFSKAWKRDTYNRSEIYTQI